MAPVPILKKALPELLKHVPYIHQGHSIKAFLSLNYLIKKFPQWDEDIWNDILYFLEIDEPKVQRLYHRDFIKLEKIVDYTEGRQFTPKSIVANGLLPLSYWGVWKLYQEIGPEEIFKSFREIAAEKIGYLGHEVSILCSYFHILPYVQGDEELTLYVLERFSEFVASTYVGERVNAFEIEGEARLEKNPSQMQILESCLKNPDFFGHNVLAFSWTICSKKFFTEKQVLKILTKVYEMCFWDVPPKNKIRIDSYKKKIDENTFEDLLLIYLKKGPRNVHLYTLAGALSYLWDNYKEESIRRLIIGNILHFTHTARST